MTLTHGRQALRAAVQFTALLAASCTTHSLVTPPASADIRSADSEPLDPLAKLAVDLVEADAAYALGDSDRLAQLVSQIRNRGANPLDKSAPDLVALWQESAESGAPPMRGRALGPGYLRGSLGQGSTVSLHQLLLAGEPTSIAIGSRQPGDLRLRIYDGKDKLVCERDPAHARTCRFTPVFTQRFRIELSNRGPSDAVYYLTMD